MEFATSVLDGRTQSDELRHLDAPLIAADVESYADDAVGAKLVGFLLHPGHRQLPGRVHRLREHAHFLALFPSCLLISDVVDRAADDEAERPEARCLHEQELINRKIGGEKPTLQRIHALTAMLRDTSERVWVIAHRSDPPCLIVTESSAALRGESHSGLIRRVARPAAARVPAAPALSCAPRRQSLAPAPRSTGRVEQAQ